jgi:uncharacterized protein (DUF1697 family)
MAAMAVSVALLRGVNIGPHRRVAMADVRAALTAAGFGDVHTHLQSGNVVLESDLAGDELGGAVAAALSERLGLTTDVIVRSPQRIAHAIAADPFGDVATDPARHVLGFCRSAPAPDKIDEMERRIAAQQSASVKPAGDRHAFAGDHFYLWCPNGISKSPYFKVPWTALGVASTQRNWNTVTALLRLAR